MNKFVISRFGWVDSLRGLSTMMVFILHLWLRIKDSLLSNTWTNMIGKIIFGYLDFGKVGVIVFFFVSGYLIPVSLTNQRIRDFIVTRFFRLYPAYWFSLLMLLLLNDNVLDDRRTFFVNLSMFQKFFGFEDLIGVYWTLQIELVFYFICIGLYYFNKLYVVGSERIGIVFFLFAIVLSFLRYYLEMKLPVALFLALTVMFFGMLLRSYEDNGEQCISRKKLIILGLAFIFFLLPTTILSYGKDYGNHETWYRYFLSYVCGFSIFLLFWNFKLSGYLFQYIGKISYSFYLLHTLILDYFLKYLNSLGLPIYFILTISVSLSLAMLSYYVIELPLIKFCKRKLIYNNK